MELFFHYLSQPYLLTGILYTLLITALGLGGGLVMGIVLAGMQLSRFPILAVITRAYAIIFRGTPLILQMIFCYNALPMIGIKLTAVEAAGLALALNEAPFIAEIIRGNIIAVDRGQIVAGQALGMTPAVVMLRVVAPQAIRSMVPALGNEAVSALKNSSLASVVSVQELTLRSTQLASANFDFFSVFFASGLMYLVLTGAVAVIQMVVEILLDLDPPTPEARLARLLPWRRQPVEAVRECRRGTRAARNPPAAARLPAAPARRRGALDRPREAHGRAQGQPPALEIKALRKSYDGKTVLEFIDLTVRIGEVVALLGPSGSGKSTLLRCINHLEGWDSGAIKCDGRGRSASTLDNRPLSPRAIANERATVGVGMVFQNFNLFGHLTAQARTSPGPLRWVQGLSHTDADRRARELLDRVGLSDRADALPRHMSGGQQQRVAIARALAPNPTILLLDEPTSALDPELVSEVLEVIRRLAVEDGLTMMISTHQIGFAKEVADRAVFLADGSIVEEGPADVVLSRPKNPRTAQFLQIMTDEASHARDSGDPDRRRRRAAREPCEASGTIGDHVNHHKLPVSPSTVHWGYFSKVVKPALTIKSGDRATIETLTHHANDDYERMIKDDPAAEAIFHWTKDEKTIRRRGAGPTEGKLKFGPGEGPRRASPHRPRRRSRGPSPATFWRFASSTCGLDRAAAPATPGAASARTPPHRGASTITT